ncbi:hypothetical protein ES332_A04G130100v1 [Gossypium tomentosum]|uniref:Uncharacterized protein n=1 Tax=Gossypium tomentosum TaxID=34277 RepID=A0A5D2QYG4_GOSTO|nr:hypothetical protein ES332_A04G130100v1 [Gossypium tomentosum]
MVLYLARELERRNLLFPFGNRSQRQNRGSDDRQSAPGFQVHGGSTGVKTGHFGARKQPSGIVRAEGAHGRGVRRKGELGFSFS